MALEARCRNDSGRLRSCPHWNRPECRCRRAVRSPNAANPATCSRPFLGTTTAAGLQEQPRRSFSQDGFEVKATCAGGAVRTHRLRVRFGFQKSSIWSRRHQKIAAVDHAQECMVSAVDLLVQNEDQNMARPQIGTTPASNAWVQTRGQRWAEISDGARWSQVA